MKRYGEEAPPGIDGPEMLPDGVNYVEVGPGEHHDGLDKLIDANTVFDMAGSPLTPKAFDDLGAALNERAVNCLPLPRKVPRYAGEVGPGEIVKVKQAWTPEQIAEFRAVWEKQLSGVESYRVPIFTEKPMTEREPHPATRDGLQAVILEAIRGNPGRTYDAIAETVTLAVMKAVPAGVGTAMRPVASDVELVKERDAAVNEAYELREFKARVLAGDKWRLVRLEAATRLEKNREGHRTHEWVPRNSDLRLVVLQDADLTHRELAAFSKRLRDETRRVGELWVVFNRPTGHEFAVLEADLEPWRKYKGPA